jgi:hypothetical protein
VICELRSDWDWERKADANERGANATSAFGTMRRRKEAKIIAVPAVSIPYNLPRMRCFRTPASAVRPVAISVTMEGSGTGAAGVRVTRLE